MQTETSQIKERIIRLPEVKQITGLSRSSIYAFINEGTFPKQISLGARSIGFVEREIDEWITQKIADSKINTEKSA